MSRIVRCSLIQASNAAPPDASLESTKKAMIDKHVAYIQQAADAGVRIGYRHKPGWRRRRYQRTAVSSFFVILPSPAFNKSRRCSSSASNRPRKLFNTNCTAIAAEVSDRSSLTESQAKLLWASMIPMESFNLQNSGEALAVSKHVAFTNSERLARFFSLLMIDDR